MENLDDFYKESKRLIQVSESFSSKHQLVGRVRVDHLCYKCESRDSFEKIREMLENESEYVFQSIISGRRIAIVRLKGGVETSLGTINFLELSDQKPDGSQREGFDHVEVYPVGWTYEELVRELQEVEVVKKIERPHHTTHDITLKDGFIFRLTEEPLIEKIKRSEMN